MVPAKRPLFQPRLRFLGPESAHPAPGSWGQAKSRLPPPILPIPPPPPRGRAGKPVGSWLPAARVWSRRARGCGTAQRPRRATRSHPAPAAHSPSAAMRWQRSGTAPPGLRAPACAPRPWDSPSAPPIAAPPIAYPPRLPPRVLGPPRGSWPRSARPLGITGLWEGRRHPNIPF